MQQQPNIAVRIWRNFVSVVLSTIILTIFFLIGHSAIGPTQFLNFTDSLDYSFWYKALAILSVYIITFIGTNMLVKKTFKQPVSTVAMILIALNLLFWRFIGGGLEYIDCNNNCSTNILPRAENDLITILVMVVLIVLLMMQIRQKHQLSR